MGNIFKSLFGKSDNDTDKKKKEDRKSFEIFKYDGLRAQRMGKPDYAIKCFTEALAIEEDFETLGYLTNVYIQTGRLQDAITRLKRMVVLEPEIGSTYLTLANVYFMEEDYSSMKEVSQQAVDLGDDAVALFQLARADNGLGDQVSAIVDLTKSIALKEDFAEARLLRAGILMSMNEYTESAADLEYILEKESDDENALVLRGRLKAKTGDTEGAEKDFRIVTELNPFNVHAAVELGKLFIDQKKLNEAIEHFDETIELNPECAEAYYERGRAKLLNGDKDGSVEDMKKSMEMDPDKAGNITGEYNNQGEKFDNLLGFSH